MKEYFAVYVGVTYVSPVERFTATMGPAAPSFIMIIARILQSFNENKIVPNLFTSLRHGAAEIFGVLLRL